MIDASFTFNSGIKKLKDAILEPLETRVGILAETNGRTDDENEGGTIDNATLGMIHEFGSFQNNIPARSFLRMPIQEKSKEIQKKILKKKAMVEEAMADGDGVFLYDILGIEAEVAVQGAFESQGYGKWKPNETSTILNKGSGSPLINSGQLRESIISKVAKKNGG